MDNRWFERLKIGCGVLAAAVLLMAVILLGGMRDSYSGSSGPGQQTAGSESTNLEVISSGRTVWSYFEEGVLPPDDTSGRSWLQAGYAEGSWKSGKGTFGSVKGERTDKVNDKLPANLLKFYNDEQEALPVYCFRTEFEIEDPEEILKLTGEVQYDDSVILYLNGEPVYEGNVPKEGYEENLYGREQTVDSSLKEKFEITDVSLLRKGTNVIAAELHQSGPKSSDIYFDLKKLVCIKSDTGAGILDGEGIILEPGKNEEQVRVNWLTGQTGSYKLQISKTAGSVRRNVYTDIPMEEVSDEDGKWYCYTADIDGLELDTRYFYRIASQDGQCVTDIYEYKTPAEGDSFSFLFAGDPQLGSDELASDAEGWERTLSVGKSIDADAAFFMTAGDQIDSSNKKDALEEYYALRSPDILKSLPLYVNKGNHEYDSSLYDGQFCSDSDNGNFYRTYQNVLFIGLDSNRDNVEAHRKFIQEAVEQNPSRWIIVTMHHPLYGGRVRSKSIEERREAYADIFSEMGVDLVLTGHDHLYSRSYVMDGTEITGRSGGVLEEGQTLHLSGGSSTGSKYYMEPLEKPEFLDVMLQEDRPYLTDIEVSEDRISIRTYRVTDREIVDSVDLIKK